MIKETRYCDWCGKQIYTRNHPVLNLKKESGWQGLDYVLCVTCYTEIDSRLNQEKQIGMEMQR